MDKHGKTKPIAQIRCLRLTTLSVLLALCDPSVATAQFRPDNGIVRTSGSGGAAALYWAVALRPQGGLDAALGVGADLTAAKQQAIAKCEKGRSVGGWLRKCVVVASFSGNDQACVAIVNGARRIGAGGYYLFHGIGTGGDDGFNTAYTKCNRAGNGMLGWDCRRSGSICTRDAERRRR